MFKAQYMFKRVITVYLDIKNNNKIYIFTKLKTYLVGKTIS